MYYPQRIFKKYKLIEEQNRCIFNYENDYIYKFEYDNKSNVSCPNGTYYNISINKYQKDIMSEAKISSVVNPLFSENIKITYNIEKDERDEDIKIFRNNVYDYNINETKEDKVEAKNGIIYQVTTSDNQKNNTYNITNL